MQALLILLLTQAEIEARRSRGTNKEQMKDSVMKLIPDGYSFAKFKTLKTARSAHPIAVVEIEQEIAAYKAKE